MHTRRSTEAWTGKAREEDDMQAMVARTKLKVVVNLMEELALRVSTGIDDGDLERLLTVLLLKSVG